MTAKSEMLSNLSSDLSTNRRILAQAQQDKASALEALVAAKSELESAESQRESSYAYLTLYLGYFPFNSPKLKASAVFVTDTRHWSAELADDIEKYTSKYDVYSDESALREIPWLKRHEDRAALKPMRNLRFAAYKKHRTFDYKDISKGTRFTSGDFMSAGADISQILSLKGMFFSQLIETGSAQGYKSKLTDCIEMAGLLKEEYSKKARENERLIKRFPSFKMSKGNGMWFDAIFRLDHQYSIMSYEYLRDSSEQLISYLQTVLSYTNDFESVYKRKASLLLQIRNLEQAVERNSTLITEVAPKVREGEQSQQQVEQALDDANAALSLAKAELTTAQQAMDEAQASLSQATSERRAAEMLLSEVRVHLAQAQTDKARTESELLAARTTLNQASVQFGKAHQSLMKTGAALHTARGQLGEAIELHGQVNTSLSEANHSKHQALSAIERAQQYVQLAHYSVWRKANADLVSND
ncbi:hypothetical protein, partial [Vibrio coralliilyticus]|uniref:hypothetical protein n=1 Tax=Vibrio coralliilyticus TaxID=190893 RepID=UPI0019D6BBEA